jgi:hypothetical protein
MSGGVKTAIYIASWSRGNQFPSALKLKLLSSETSRAVGIVRRVGGGGHIIGQTCEVVPQGARDGDLLHEMATFVSRNSAGVCFLHL